MFKYSDFKILFKTGGLYVVFDVINKMVPFALLPLLTHYIYPAEFGILNNFVTIITIVNVFLAFGAGGFIAVKYYNHPKSYISSLISSILHLLFISVIFCFVFLFIFNDLIFKYTNVPSEFIFLALIAAVGQFLSLLNMTLWRLDTKPIVFGIYQISQTLVDFSLSIFFVVNFLMDWQGRAYGMILAYALFGIYSVYTLYKRGFIKNVWNSKIIKECLLFGLPMIPHGLANWMKIGLDRIYLTNLVGLGDSGIYSVAVQFGLVLSVILIAFNNAYSPYLFKSLAHINDRIKVKLVSLTYLYVIIILFSVFVLYFGSKLVILTFLDEKYHGAIVFLPWILLSNAFMGFYFMTVNFIFYSQKNGIVAIITFSTTLLHAIISFLLIKQMGALGSVISLSITNFLTFILVWWQSNRCINLPWFSFLKF